MAVPPRPAGRVVLVTGVSRDLGRRFARSAAAHAGVERVIGVDAVPPRGDIGGVSFVRADIRNPVIAKVIAKEAVDTVVHMSVIATPGSTGGRTMMKELNVIGTMQLLAACQTAPTVRQVVVKSTTTVYGASNRDPAMFSEEMEPRRSPYGGYAKDVADVESYVRGFSRRRPDVAVTLLRCANVLGPTMDSPLAEHLRLPVIPTVLGFDPRLQFLHELDLYAVIGHAIRTGVPGTFNVAGDGFLTLSQIARRLGRPTVPVPAALLRYGAYGSGRQRLPRRSEYSPELRGLLSFGRGVDTTRMRRELGFEPAYSTAETIADFGAGQPVTGGRIDRALAGLEQHLVPGAARLSLVGAAGPAGVSGEGADG
ncbi:MAG: NAD-dependent epimerase/dehydratase family protein [Nocardioides sp.]|uniref:NAD-dependent epimerase/dehydratase family protein n=1 Tax=Nocardioides sp. TaxID=35761 RepID=UPI0039E2DCFD